MRYAQIINQGEICEVLAVNGHGALLLKNNEGPNRLFHKKAVIPIHHGQHALCVMCGHYYLYSPGQLCACNQ